MGAKELKMFLLFAFRLVYAKASRLPLLSLYLSLFPKRKREKGISQDFIKNETKQNKKIKQNKNKKIKQNTQKKKKNSNFGGV